MIAKLIITKDGTRKLVSPEKKNGNTKNTPSPEFDNNAAPIPSITKPTIRSMSSRILNNDHPNLEVLRHSPFYRRLL